MDDCRLHPLINIRIYRRRAGREKKKEVEKRRDKKGKIMPEKQPRIPQENLHCEFVH